MKLNTKALGEIEISEEDIITFPEGILAFEDYRRFIIISEKENGIFKWLQSVDEANLAFLVVNPADITSSYQPVLHQQALELVGSPAEDEISLWCIVTVPQNSPENMTINLQGPLVINLKKGMGGQFISSSVQHQVKARILDLIEKNEVV